MSEGDSVEGAAIECKQAAQDVASHFTAHAVTPAARLVRLMWPGMSSTQIAADLGGRITASNVRQWRTGKRHVPAWVIEEMRARHAAIGAAIAQMKTGPGIKAGFGNIGAWNASRNVER